jgi:hypothetical protein
MSKKSQHRVYRLAWDGELSMNGKPHVMSLGPEFDSLALAQNARDRVPSMKNKPNLRIETRQVTEWEVLR